MKQAPFHLPPELGALVRALAAIARTRGAAVWLVGGTVRDMLLGRPVRDLDLALDRDAMGAARAMADALGGRYVPLDDAHGIARIVLPSGPVSYVDVAQLQGALEQDLRRRDFTIDALAVPVDAKSVLDVTGGLDDLHSRTLRMTSEDVLDADPLRLLRGARIATELGFALEPVTAGAIRLRRAKIGDAAAERQRDELARILALEVAGLGVRMLDDLGLLDELIPELGAGRGCTQPENHHAYDVFEHNVRTLEALDLLLAPSPPSGDSAWLWRTLWRSFKRWEAGLRTDLSAEVSEGRSRGALLKLASLLHDVAKPQTRAVEDHGRIRFLGHADEGAAVAARIMRRLRFSSREIAFVSLLVAEHLRPVQLAPLGSVPTKHALYRFHRDVGDAVPAVLLLALGDASAARGERMSEDGWSRQVAYMNSLLVRLSEEEGIVHAPRLLTGHDIIAAFGLAEGPQIGRLLEALREAQAVGDIKDRDSALAFVRARLA